MLVWANTHPGVITGQALLAGAVAWEWLNRRLKLNPPLTHQACWRLTLFAGLDAGVAGLSGAFERAPALGDVSTEPGPPDHARLRRDDAATLARGRPPYLAGLIYLVAALVLLAVVKRFRTFRLWEIALLAGVGGSSAATATAAPRTALLVMLAVGVPRLVDLYRQAGPARVPRPSAHGASAKRADRARLPLPAGLGAVSAGTAAAGGTGATLARQGLAGCRGAGLHRARGPPRQFLRRSHHRLPRLGGRARSARCLRRYARSSSPRPSWRTLSSLTPRGTLAPAAAGCSPAERTGCCWKTAARCGQALQGTGHAALY